MSALVQNKAFYAQPAGTVDANTAFEVGNVVVVMFSGLADPSVVTIAGTAAQKLVGNDNNNRYCSIWSARVVNAARTDVVFVSAGAVNGSLTEVSGLQTGDYIDTYGVTGAVSDPAFCQIGASISQGDVVAFGCWVDCTNGAEESTILDAGWDHCFDGGDGVPAGAGAARVFVDSPLVLLAVGWNSGGVAHTWRGAMVALKSAAAVTDGTKALMFARP